MHFSIPRRGEYGSTSPFARSPSPSKAAARQIYTQKSFFQPARQEHRWWGTRRTLFTKNAMLFLILLLLLIFFWWFGADPGQRETKAVNRAGPVAVIVLVLDAQHNRKPYLDKIIENRREYARAHGYGLYVRKSSDFDLGRAQPTWVRVAAIREAMRSFPRSEWFWLLDQDAIIMNPSLSLQEHITDLPRLNSLILRDIPIVPPDSVMRTPKHVPAAKIDFIISQDHEGLHPGSMLMQRGDYAHYLLDAWFDPMLRNYDFIKGDQHSLEHLAQWHPTILNHMAVIPQRILNSYANSPGDSEYQDGDFVVHFDGCDQPERSCEKEFLRMWNRRGRAQAVESEELNLI